MTLKNKLIFAVLIRIISCLIYFTQNTPLCVGAVPSLRNDTDKPPAARAICFMKTILINSPKFGPHEVLVDDDDFDLVNKLKWQIHVDPKRTKRYACRSTKPNGKHVVIRMHRLILGVNDPKISVDHRNGNSLDNRRCNLRVATISQNNMNKPGRIRTSKYKGVSWDETRNKWRATIRANNKWKQLGRFENERDAAIAYNGAARIVHDEFAYLNKVE